MNQKSENIKHLSIEGFYFGSRYRTFQKNRVNVSILNSKCEKYNIQKFLNI